MGWRTVVVTGNAKLEYKLDYLVIRKVESVNKVHLSEVKLLIVESTAVSITSMLLCELNKMKVRVVFCDEKHHPYGELNSYYGSHDTSLKVRQQAQWQSGVKSVIWTDIVAQKIRNQSLLLLETNHEPEAMMLQEYIAQIELGDSTNREGHAAKVYFNALFGKSFSRSQDSPINAALNYGYGVLLSFFNREVVANGYITQLGIFHDNMFNQYNLSSDLLEPFRFLVDRKVIEMQPERFEKEERYEILQLFSQELVIDGKTQYLPKAISIYCKSVFNAIEEKDTSLIKYCKYEL